MPRLHPRIDHQRTVTAPVLVLRRSSNPVHIMARIRAGESRPDKVTEVFCHKSTVVADYDHANARCENFTRFYPEISGGKTLQVVQRLTSGGGLALDVIAAP